MEYSAQRQSGSTIVYVIIGIVLAAASVGAIIVAQHRGGQQIASQPSTEVSQPADEQSGGEQDSSNSESDNKPTEEEKREAAEEKKVEEAKEARQAEQEKQAKKDAEAKRAKEEAAREQAEKEQATVNQQGPMARTGVEQPAGALPETGPVEDTLSMVVGIIAIIGAGYFYYHFGGRH